MSMGTFSFASPFVATAPIGATTAGGQSPTQRLNQASS
jgi:hypothetical protein